MVNQPRKLRYPRKQKYPNINDGNHDVTSDNADWYNCVAWALGLDDRRMWPHPTDRTYEWPTPRRDDSVEAFTEGLAHFGFVPCPNDSYEEGYQKVALYVVTRLVQHALYDAYWTMRQLEPAALVREARLLGAKVVT